MFMQFNSSVQFKIIYIYAHGKESLHALYPVYQRCFQCCLSDSSSVGLIDVASSRPFEEDGLVLPLSTSLPSTQRVHVYSVTYTPGSICRLCPARSCVILVCMVLFNVCRDRNTDRIFATFPTQFVILQKLTELSLSIPMQLYFWVLSFLTLCRRCCSAAP